MQSLSKACSVESMYRRQLSRGRATSNWQGAESSFQVKPARHALGLAGGLGQRGLEPGGEDLGHAGLEVLYEEQDFRRYSSTSRASLPYLAAHTSYLTVLQYVYTWLILQFCGRSGPTGTFGNSVPPTKRRTQVSRAGQSPQCRRAAARLPPPP